MTIKNYRGRKAGIPNKTPAEKMMNDVEKVLRGMTIVELAVLKAGVDRKLMERLTK